MNNIKQHTEQFLQRGTEQLKKRQKEALTKIADNFEALNRFIKARQDSAAMSEWKSNSELEVPMSSIAPEYFKYGTLQMVNAQGKVFDKLSIPLLLPTNVNAVIMNLGDDAEKVPNLFQSLIIRLLLSMRMDLVKVSVVDMDYGSSFPVLSSINNSMFKKQIIPKSDPKNDVTQLISDLAKEIVEANQKFMGRHPDIDAYNASAGEMAQPYHFVFIDDFPDGFTPQSIDNLLRLIDNGNAARVGIKIFINYSAKKHAQMDDFDSKRLKLERFKKSCSFINIDTCGKISFENWPLPFPPNVIPAIDLDLPDKVENYVDFFNGMKQKEVVYTLDPWIEDLKKRNLVWSGDTSDGIKVPIGFITPTKTFDFYLANDRDSKCNDYFALVAGGMGSGKTVFLHNIIVNAAMKYSPEDLCLYLVDFSPQGASFRIYRNLPHVRSLLLANNKEYVLRMLEDIENIANERSQLYERLAEDTNKIVDKLSIYRTLADDSYPKISRVLVIMDELQGLLKTDEYSQIVIRIREKIDNGIKQWRKFGISMVLCTQTFAGVDIGNAKELVTYRFALKLPERDSEAVIRNNAAASINVIGRAIMNNTNDGRPDMNVSFQSAYSDRYLDEVGYLDKLYQQRYNHKHIPFICQSEIKTDIRENHLLISHIENNSFEVDNSECSVYIGKPDLLRTTHTRIRYRRQLHSNTIIIGEDYKTLVFVIAVQLIQLMKQSDAKSKFYIVDCSTVGDKFKGALDEIDSLHDGSKIGNSQSIEEFVNNLADDLERRKNAQKEGRMIEERSFVIVINSQYCDDLRKQGHRPSQITEKLKTILTDGAPLGMHCIVHMLSYGSMFGSDGVFESRDFSLFENVIFLKGADIDKTPCYNLKIDAPEKNGRMIVINAKVDGEAYEQCKTYSDITVDGEKNVVTEFMSNLFEKYRPYA